MLLFQLAILAIVQGITEFLPISSSGHLILIPALTGWPDQGLTLDIAVHIGSITAVMLYFRADVWKYSRALLRLPVQGWTPDSTIAISIILATLPVVITGFIFKDYIENNLRVIELIALTSIIFGLVLYALDMYCPQVKTLADMRYSRALIIGVAQCLALMPGTSRSGITMTAARMLGFNRTESARYSLLLSIPVTLGAGVLLTKDVVEGHTTAPLSDIAIGAGLSFIASYLAIHYMMQWLKNYSFTPFVVYRVGLGVALLAYAWWP